MEGCKYWYIPQSLLRMSDRYLVYCCCHVKLYLLILIPKNWNQDSDKNLDMKSFLDFSFPMLNILIQKSFKITRLL